MNYWDISVMKPFFMLLAILFISQLALSDEFPTRKAGLWEIDTTMAGIGSVGKMKQCVSTNTDREMSIQAQEKGGQICSKNSTRKVGNEYIHESDCKFDKYRMISRMVIKGDFSNNYTGHMVTRTSPPIAGSSESTMTITGRWLGAC